MSFDKSNALDRSGSDRPDGYYWVRVGKEWQVAEFCGAKPYNYAHWNLCASEMQFTEGVDIKFSEIHGPIRPPDYGNALEEWGPEHTQHISDTQ